MVGSPNTLHPWHVLFAVLFGAVLGFGGCSPRVARADEGTNAGNQVNQGAAYAYCIAENDGRGRQTRCEFDAYGPASGQAACNAGRVPAGSYVPQILDYYGAGTGWTTTPWAGVVYWCVPATCTAYDSGSPTQQWSGDIGINEERCSDDCLSHFVPQDVGSVCFGGGDCWSFGHFVGDSGAGRCNADADASMFRVAQPKPVCDPGQVSCYNPDRGYCAHTESGETICEPGPPPGTGACATGATGATCVGNGVPPPAPPDPPVPKDTPPQSSAIATQTAGSSTTNINVSSYSGTSPGGSGGESTPGSSAPSSPGGTSTNHDGNGNSGGKGTDSSGKCPDGSVPTASGCSGTYRDDGCDHPPACYGDAVLCGIAVNTHAAACKPASSTSSGGYGDVSSALAGAGVPADGGASGDPSASSLVSSSDVGSDGFDSSGLGFSRACPAPPSFSFHGHTFVLNIQPVCDWASLFGYMVLLLAYLAGLKIVSTGKA